MSTGNAVRNADADARTTQADPEQTPASQPCDYDQRWVLEVVVLDADDKPLADMLVELQATASSCERLRTDQDGRTRFDGVEAKAYNATLAALDQEAWEKIDCANLPDDETRSANKLAFDLSPEAAAPATDHEVVEGDCLSNLGMQYGLLPTTIWNDAGNEALRKQRKLQNVLAPGDRVHIPACRQKRETVHGGERLRLRRKEVPERFRVRFLEIGQKPRAGLAFSCQVTTADGEILAPVDGTLDQDGFLQQAIPPDARAVQVHLQTAGDGERYKFELGRPRSCRSRRRLARTSAQSRLSRHDRTGRDARYGCAARLSDVVRPRRHRHARRCHPRETRRPASVLTCASTTDPNSSGAATPPTDGGACRNGRACNCSTCSTARTCRALSRFSCAARHRVGAARAQPAGARGPSARTADRRADLVAGPATRTAASYGECSAGASTATARRTAVARTAAAHGAATRHAGTGPGYVSRRRRPGLPGQDDRRRSGERRTAVRGMHQEGERMSGAQAAAELLWPDESQTLSRVFALLDPTQGRDARRHARRDDLRTLRLFEGALTPSLAAVSPVLVQVPQDERSLLAESWGRHWGLWIRSTAEPQSLQRHLASLLRVRTSAAGASISVSTIRASCAPICRPAPATSCGACSGSRSRSSSSKPNARRGASLRPSAATGCCRISFAPHP